MFDIIIKDGKKESYIKLNGNKLEGFNAQNGVITPLTIEEVNSINLLKLSDNRKYLGKDNEYDVYLDNNSGLKHYFKDGKEDIKATWEHNGEDALLYSGNKINKVIDKIKKLTLKDKIILISQMAMLAVAASNFAFEVHDLKTQEIRTALSNYYYDSNIEDLTEISKKYYDYANDVTLEQIENYIKENENLTEEEKEMFYNEKLLQDILPYYEDTNMNLLIPLKFEDLQIEYCYEEPKQEDEEKDTNGYESVRSAYYNALTPNRLYINTYFGTEDRYDDKAHEYVHLLQAVHEYQYIKEACAEIISCEYDKKCVNKSYLEPVNNTKILMEIVGPEPVWKLNFSGDDTDLVNVIRENLEEEQADKLISLLKEKPGKNQIEGLDTDITDLLSQMYQNMYGEDMRNNPFIDCLLGNGKMNRRYYFNSDLIEKTSPYRIIEVTTLPANYTFWYVYVFSSNYYLNPEIDIKDYIYNKDVGMVFMLSKNQLQCNDLRAIEEDVFLKNEIKFYYHGEEFTKDNFDLSKYEEIPFNFVGGINPEVKTEIRNIYYPTIYETFPSQRIGKTSSITK